MPLTLKQDDNNKEFEILPKGQYTARCFKVIDLGTQVVEWNGQEKLQPKVQITWEILDDEVKMEDSRPFAISRTYTASLNEKSNLYQDLVSWRGAEFTKEELLGFDISKLLGAYCQVQVIHREVGDRTYANINTIMGTKERPKGVNPEVMFDISNPDMDVFDKFPEYLQTKIRDSQEWQANKLKAPEVTSENTTDPTVNKDIVIEDIEETIDLKDIPF